MSRNQRRNRRNKSGGGQTAHRHPDHDGIADRSAGAVLHRPSTETKSSLKTTELIAYAGAVLAVVMTALAVDQSAEGGNDPFGAELAIRYVTYLTVGYLIARGLAKSGSQENRLAHDADLDDDDGAARAVTIAEDDLDRQDDDAEPEETADVPSGEVEHASAGAGETRP